jgi:uncharacterized protein
MIRLRPHHLMCILTYVGRGYTASFVQNMDQVAGAIREGAEVCLMSGPDDVCAGLQEEDRHCERSSVTERDHSATLALMRILDMDIEAGTPFLLSTDTLSRLRSRYLQEREQTCGGCEWYDLCGRVARTNFLETKLQQTA